MRAQDNHQQHSSLYSSVEGIFIEVVVWIWGLRISVVQGKFRGLVIFVAQLIRSTKFPWHGVDNGPRNFRGSGSIFRAAEFPWLGVNFQGRGISVARGQFSGPRNFRGSGSILRAAEFPWLGLNFQGRGMFVAQGQFLGPRNFRGPGSILKVAEFPWLGVNSQGRGIFWASGFRSSGCMFRASEFRCFPKLAAKDSVLRLPFRFLWWYRLTSTDIQICSAGLEPFAHLNSWLTV